MAVKEMYSAPIVSDEITLISNIDATASTISVDYPDKLPPAPNLFTLGYDTNEPEVILYTGKNTTSLTGCQRGYNGSQAKSWQAGNKGARVFNSYDHNSFKENIDDVYSNISTINESLEDIDVGINDIAVNYIRQPAFSHTSGTASAYTVQLSPAPLSIDEGFGITIVPHVANSGSVTLSINNTTAIPLKKAGGDNFADGDLKAGSAYSFRKVGTNFLEVSVREGGGSGGGGEFVETAVNVSTTFPTLVNGDNRFTLFNIPAGAKYVYFRAANSSIFYNAASNTSIGYTKPNNSTVNGIGFYLQHENNTFTTLISLTPNQTGFINLWSFLFDIQGKKFEMSCTTYSKDNLGTDSYGSRSAIVNITNASPVVAIIGNLYVNINNMTAKHLRMQGTMKVM